MAPVNSCGPARSSSPTSRADHRVAPESPSARRTIVGCGWRLTGIGPYSATRAPAGGGGTRHPAHNRRLSLPDYAGRSAWSSKHSPVPVPRGLPLSPARWEGGWTARRASSPRPVDVRRAYFTADMYRTPRRAATSSAASPVRLDLCWPFPHRALAAGGTSSERTALPGRALRLHRADHAGPPLRRGRRPQCPRRLHAKPSPRAR